MFTDFISNNVLIACIISWAVAQVLKVIVILIQEKRLAWNYFVTSGGMPSSHSSTVCTLATALAIQQGLNSTGFSIAVVLAVIVMYDAAGVRQSVGKHSVVLNRIIKEFKFGRSTEDTELLREFIGHTPTQVIAGAILGILIGWGWMVTH